MKRAQLIFSEQTQQTSGISVLILMHQVTSKRQSLPFCPSLPPLSLSLSLSSSKGEIDLNNRISVFLFLFLAFSAFYSPALILVKDKHRSTCHLDVSPENNHGSDFTRYRRFQCRHILLGYAVYRRSGLPA